MPHGMRRRGGGPRSRSARIVRVAVVAGGMAAMVAGSSGCVIYRTSPISQPGLIGPVALDVHACISAVGSQCPEQGLSNLSPQPTGNPVQVLVAIEAPVSWVLPDVIPGSTSTDPSSFRATMRRSPSYEAAIAERQPTSPGKRWNGYISDPITTWNPGETLHNFVILDRLPMPDGGPNTVPPDVRYATGGRVISDQLTADRPVACGLAEGTVCDDSVVGVSYNDRLLHDLRLVAPASVTAVPGTTVLVPVTARFAGPAGPEFSFALTTATTLPGAVATPNVPTLTPPSDSDSSLNMSVAVPANTTPGTYAVTMTATVGGTRQSTSATVNLVVPAGGTAPGTPGTPGTSGATPPSVSLRVVRGFPAKTARAKGLPVRLTSDAPATATVTLSQTRRIRSRGRVVLRSVRVARRTVAVPAGTSTVRVKSPALRPGPVTIRVTGPGFSARTSTVLG